MRPVLPAAAALAALLAGIPAGAKPPARNFVENTPSLASSGMPTRKQFALVGARGYDVVVNLAPAGVHGAHPDEAGLVRGAGLRYHHVPVDFASPRREDYERFAAILDDERGRRVLVHCQVNLRASSFVFLYRVLERGEDAERAWEDVARIWQPDPTWRAFLQARLAERGVAAPLELGEPR